MEDIMEAEQLSTPISPVEQGNLPSLERPESPLPDLREQVALQRDQARLQAKENQSGGEIPTRASEFSRLFPDQESLLAIADYQQEDHRSVQILIRHEHIAAINPEFIEVFGNRQLEYLVSLNRTEESLQVSEVKLLIDWQWTDPSAETETTEEEDTEDSYSEDIQVVAEQLPQEAESATIVGMQAVRRDAHTLEFQA